MDNIEPEMRRVSIQGRTGCPASMLRGHRFLRFRSVFSDTRGTLSLVSAASIALLACLSNDAAAAPAARSRQIDIRYVPPKSDSLKPVYDYLREAKGLERIRETLAGLKLPRRLLIKAEEFNGEANAWYDGKDVTICYEFVDDIWKNAATETTPNGLAPIDTLVGPFLDVVLHETAHALFHILRIPLCMLEGDGAEQLSAHLMLQ